MRRDFPTRGICDRFPGYAPDGPPVAMRRRVVLIESDKGLSREEFRPLL